MGQRFFCWSKRFGNHCPGLSAVEVLEEELGNGACKPTLGIFCSPSTLFASGHRVAAVVFLGGDGLGEGLTQVEGGADRG